MTYKIISAKASTSILTKDPSKDVAWGNTFYGVDDCIRINVPEKSQEEIDKIEALTVKKADLFSIELKSLRKLFDGEDITAVNAERLKLRNEIKALEKA